MSSNSGTPVIFIKQKPNADFTVIMLVFNILQKDYLNR